MDLLSALGYPVAMSTPRFLQLFVLLSSFALLPAQDVFFFPQVGDGRAGPIRFQTSFIFVNTGGDTTITLDFFATETGDPLAVTLGGLGTQTSFEIPLSAGASVSVQTPGTGGIIVGYARITAPPGASVGGTAVFTRTDIPSGTILYEAGVPAARDLNDFTIFVDTIGDRNTGLAVVNTDRSAIPATSGNEVQMRLFDLGFNEIATTVVPLPGGVHDARFVPEIFDAVPQAAEMEGTVTVSSPDDLAAVTLRTNDAMGIDFPDEVPTLTAFPVVEGNAALMAGFSGKLALSQSGKLSATLEFSGKYRPEGALFLLYRDGKLLDASYHDLPGAASGTETVQLGQVARVDHVEVQLLFPGVRNAPRFVLRP